VVSAAPEAPELHHASCVALHGRGLLITGASGAGKSGLALRLMALGAQLVADDQVQLHRAGRALQARCPDRIAGLIEARGVGLLRADHLAEVPLALVVDLDRHEPDRLPPRREIVLLGCPLPLVLGRDAHHLAPALLQYLRAGRAA